MKTGRLLRCCPGGASVPLEDGFAGIIDEFTGSLPVMGILIAYTSCHIVTDLHCLFQDRERSFANGETTTTHHLVRIVCRISVFVKLDFMRWNQEAQIW